MKDLFYMGGAFFMATLSILFLLMLVYAAVNLTAILNKNNGNIMKVRSRLAHIKSIGLFSVIPISVP